MGGKTVKHNQVEQRPLHWCDNAFNTIAEPAKAAEELVLSQVTVRWRELGSSADDEREQFEGRDIRPLLLKLTCLTTFWLISKLTHHTVGPNERTRFCCGMIFCSVHILFDGWVPEAFHTY